MDKVPSKSHFSKSPSLADTLKIPNFHQKLANNDIDIQVANTLASQPSKVRNFMQS
jgi:hypothetical protein